MIKGSYILFQSCLFACLLRFAQKRRPKRGAAEIDAGGEWWLGKLDDIGTWDRALTSSEVATLYHR